MMNQTKNDKQQIIPDATPQVNEIADHIHRILVLLGEDPQREGLIKTPMRYAKALWFLTQGYRQSADEIINQAIFEYAGSK